MSQLPSGWPTFLLIGAAKAGTTSLYQYLGQHPEIYASRVKEPRFFALEGHPLDFRGPGDDRIREHTTTTLEAYRKLFAKVGNRRAAGEASVLYIHHPDAAAAIARSVPEVKLIALLRDPAERAYSGFLFLTRDGLEPLATFEEALDDEPRRIADRWYYGWHYRDQGFYYRNLKRYFDRFDRTRIRVYLTDDLERDPAAVMKDVFGFLEVDDGFQPNLEARYNPSGVARSAGVQRLLTKRHPVKEAIKAIVPERWGHRVISWLQPKNLVRPPLRPETRAGLMAGYREDLLRLEDLIGRDLSIWHGRA